MVLYLDQEALAIPQDEVEIGDLHVLKAITIASILLLHQLHLSETRHEGCKHGLGSQPVDEGDVVQRFGQGVTESLEDLLRGRGGVDRQPFLLGKGGENVEDIELQGIARYPI